MSAQALTVETWLVWLRELLQEERYAKVLDAIDAHPQWRNEVTIVRYYEAMSHMHLKQWHRALEHIERLLVDKPEQPVLLLDRAWCLIELHRCHEAKQLLEADLAALIQRPPWLVLRARIAMRESNPKEAALYLEIARRMDPRVSEFIAGFEDLRAMV